MNEHPERVLRAKMGWAIRLRAVLLAAVWIVSGVSAVGHALAHDDERGRGVHVESAASDPLLSLVAAHGHGHTHASSLPDASIGKAPKLDAPVLLVGTPDLATPSVGLLWLVRATPAWVGPGRPHALGPRAPPIS